jgi:hypothetical protein
MPDRASMTRCEAASDRRGAMKTGLRRAGIAALMLTAMGVAPALTTSPAGAAPPQGPPSAGEARTLHVRGTLRPVNVDEGVYTVHGSLLGQWTTPTFTYIYNTPALAIAKGTEKFSGCVDRNRNKRCEPREPSGELNFEFIQWTRSNPDTGAFIIGRCVHPIMGGTKDFAGARGLLTMKDLPVGNRIRTTYQGDLVLNAVPSEAAARAARAGTSAAAPAPRTAPVRAGC